MTPSWVDVVEHLGTPLSGILLYVLGRASKGGANQKALDDACGKIVEISKQLERHEAILIEHTTLHRGYVAMQKQLLSVDRKLNAVCGKLGIDGVS